VLFFDIVESTPLARKLDVEEFGELMLGVHELATMTITGLGGTVGSYAGDGLVAWFGWPVAHEDDTALAVHAGLEILARLEERGAQTESVHKLATALGSLQAESIAGLLGLETGEPQAAERFRHELMETLHAWLVALARESSVVLAGEDLHWCDPSTLELLRLLRHRLAGAAVMIVVTQRAEPALDLRPDAPIVLERLDREQTRTLARALAAGHGLAPDVAERVAAASRKPPVELVEASKYTTYLPQRDGIEVGRVMALLNHPLLEGWLANEIMSVVRKWVFALDMYQLLGRCESVVFNLDGRTPDEGSVVETAAAFTAGKPIVIYKTTPITILAGTDNPMVQGLSSTWAYASDVTAIPAALASAVTAAKPYQYSPPANIAALIQEGSVIWKVLETLRGMPTGTPDELVAWINALGSS